MSPEDAENLVARQSRVRHIDGPEGLYIGCFLTGGLWLVVERDDRRVTWSVDDCEVVQ